MREAFTCAFVLIFKRQNKAEGLVQPITLFKRRARTSPTVLLFLALLLIAGCRDAAVTPTAPAAPTTPTGGGPLFVSGVMTEQYQGIRVSSGGAPVTDADVTVNGFRIPHCCGDLYSGNLSEAIPGEGRINLKVVASGVIFEASRDVIATPTVTAPAAGSTVARTDTVRLAWSTPTDPDRFEVCLNCWENSLYGEIYRVTGSAREFKILPGHLVDFGDGAVVAVYAYKTGYFLTSASSPEVTSNLQFVARSRDALITIKP